MNTKPEVPSKNEESSQITEELNFRSAFAQPQLNLSKKFSVFDKGLVGDKFQNLKTPDAVQMKLNGNEISTPLI